MAAFTRVSIGIQARSTSTRLPNKVAATLADRPMLDWVISACENAATYISRFSDKKGVVTRIALVVPEGDPIKAAYSDRIDVIEGPEHDVLTRYVNLQEKHRADYIVRITSDCPIIPPWMIGKHITLATVNGYDYCSNVDERCRTSPDGFDCEVISKKLLAHTAIAAKDSLDREHVTTWIRQNFPTWASKGFTINHVDQSGIKWSVDTGEDLERVREEIQKVEYKRMVAEAIYGKKSVHRI